MKCSLLPTPWLVGLLCLLFGVAMTSCSDGNDQIPDRDGDAAPFSELYAQGIDRYRGVYTPMQSEVQGNTVQHSFGAGDGPLCGDGSNYTMATRNQGDQDLLIFIEGGGACWSEVCLFVDFAVTGIPEAGILDTQRQDNPFRGWDQAYMPYCDGAVMSGDVDVDTDGDGTVDRYQRGLRNFSAALDVTVKTFPKPRRIVLAGQSGGGLATIFTLPLVRGAYPDTPIDVLNDSGVGVLRPDDPALVRQLIDDWDIGAFFPASCATCLAQDGHFTDYLIWQMDQDPGLRRGFLSYSRDVNLADLYLGIGGAAFEQALLQEMAQAEQAHPERFRSWLVDGSGHTFVLNEPERAAGEVPLLEWIRLMLDDSLEWVSARDHSLN